MSKNSVSGYLILGIILAVFCCISFVAPFEMNGTFWSAYIFGVIAIIFQIYVFRIAFTAGSDAKSKFYGFPIVRIGIIYLVIQLILSIVEMCTAGFMPVFVAVIVNVILLAGAVIGCIAADVVRDEVVRQDIETKIDVANMRTLQSLSASLPGLCSDAGVKKKLQELADAFRFSDPVSSENTRGIEYELGGKLQELKRIVLSGNMNAAESYCIGVKNLLDERNRVCKLSK